MKQGVVYLIKVLIVDDHPAVGEGTKKLLEEEQDIQAKVITDSVQASQIIKEEKYDIFLLDLYMPELNGIELTKLILKLNPEAIVLVYTGFDIASHFNYLIESGVSGFVSKTATKEQLITTIRCALREEVILPLQLVKQLRRLDAKPTDSEAQQNLGDIILTPQEQEILIHVSKGLTNKAIAIEMNMSQRNIEYHLTKIFNKLKVSSRFEALLKAKEYGLLSYEDEMINTN